MAQYRLLDLAGRIGVNASSARVWVSRHRAIRADRQCGRGHSTTVDDTQARAFISFVLLRRAGVSWIEINRVAPTLWKEHRDFLAVGSDGRAILLDGRGDDAPLMDPRTGQLFLCAPVDLRQLRLTIENLLNELSAGRPAQRPRGYSQPRGNTFGGVK